MTDTNMIANPPTALVEPKEMTFRFKKDKMDNKRPNVELKSVPVPTVAGVAAALNAGGKTAQLVVDAIFDLVRGVAAGIVAEDEKVNQDNFPFEKLSLEAIANMERADRRTVQISDETWAGFVADYKDIMPGVTGKSENAINLACEVYMKKFAPIKTNKEAVKKLQEQLGLYIEHTKSGEEYVEILELLSRRAENYLKADEPQILAENL